MLVFVLILTIIKLDWSMSKLTTISAHFMAIQWHLDGMIFFSFEISRNFMDLAISF